MRKKKQKKKRKKKKLDWARKIFKKALEEKITPSGAGPN